MYTPQPSPRPPIPLPLNLDPPHHLHSPTQVHLDNPTPHHPQRPHHHKDHRHGRLRQGLLLHLGALRSVSAAAAPGTAAAAHFIVSPLVVVVVGKSRAAFGWVEFEVFFVFEEEGAGGVEALGVLKGVWRGGAGGGLGGGGWWMVDGGRWMVDGGWWMVEGGGVCSGRQGGRWKGMLRWGLLMVGFDGGVFFGVGIR